MILLQRRRGKFFFRTPVTIIVNAHPSSQTHHENDKHGQEAEIAPILGTVFIGRTMFRFRRRGRDGRVSIAPAGLVVFVVGKHANVVSCSELEMVCCLFVVVVVLYSEYFM